MPKLKVFVDADVIFAGSASPSDSGASLMILRMAEITLIECITSEQAITETERNLAEKMSAKLPEFKVIVSRCLHIVRDPTPDELLPFQGQADTSDLPLLVAAIREGCSYLVTHNTRHYHPSGDNTVIRKPGEMLLAIRNWLSLLSNGDP